MSDQIAYVGDTSGDEILDVSFFEKDVDGETRDFIHIKVPGDKTVEAINECTQEYLAGHPSFARKYDAYKNMQSYDTGTPIEQWDDISEGMVREFKNQGFRFIETVAGAPDNAFARIQGGFQWRNRAQAYLNRGKKSSEDVIAQQQKELDELKQQMAALLAMNSEKRGRKSKETTQTESEKVESEE